MPFVTGSEIKGYKILERIGAGGFGAVYRADQSTVGREVAIKIILPGFANQPYFIRRFETEAQVVARLEHLHITPLYDYWRDPQGAYLVMRLMRGGSLKDALREGAFSLEETAQVIDQIASALVVAHRKGIIHRDIKPTNILLDDDKNAYLSDFGIAMDLEYDSLASQETITGSPDYLSPEQARSEPVTPQTDIYNLGVLLYELLAGEHPFPGVSSVERLFKHINQPLPIIPTFDIEISRDVNAVIQKATAKNPEKRYEHVMALASAFKEAAGLTASQAAKSLVSLLTPREQDVLKCILEGKSNREIAEDLTVELSTIKWYVNQIYRKLNVRSRVQAIVRARELNLIVDGVEPVSVGTTTAELPEAENPYKGLRAFQAADEHLYFGQEKLIKKLVTKMGSKGEYNRFLAMIGPSGSGKSSLVKAGLIPALWRGDLPGSAKWFIVEMVPGSRPLDELEIALTRIAAHQGGNIGEQLRRDSHGLLRSAGLILPDDGSELLLVIDQFEEIFTLVEGEEKRKYFLDLLYSAVTDSNSRVRILITLRADFYDRPLHYSQFGELVRNRLETVLPLSAEQLERAITMPAKQVGVEFEEGLVSTIIEDVHYQPGGLPLLQYALTELFEVRNNRTLSHDGYQQVGGVIGALANRAEELYAESDASGQESIRQMFLRLVAMGEDDAEDIRRRVPRSELLEIVDNVEAMDEIIDTFAAYRLLSLDHDPGTRTPTVEVAHEAILREWERLDNWLEGARDDIRFQRQIARAAQNWREAERDASFLLHGSRLHQYETWVQETELALTPGEWEYLKESQDEEFRIEKEEKARQLRELALEKRSRRFLQLLAGVFIVATVVSLWLAIRANQAEQVALVQASIGLAGQARLELVEGLPERAVLLALEALDNYPFTWQAERALFLAVQNHRLEHMVSDHHTDWIGFAEWSPDGLRLLTASNDGTARLWDAISLEELWVLDGHADWVSSANWSPDGARVATSSRDGTTKIWDASTGEALFTLGHEDWIVEATWSPDGKRIATGSHDGTIKIWDANSGEEIYKIEGHGDFVEIARWSPDGSQLASASGDFTARVWDADDGKELLILANHQDFVIDVSWSPDGKKIATGSFDGTAKIWDASSGDEIYSLVGEGRGEMRWVIWSPDSERLLTVERGANQIDGVAAIWDVTTGEQLFRLPGVGDLAFANWSPDGNLIAVNDEIANTRVWDAVTGEEEFVLTHPQPLGYVTWSPDGNSLATGYEDGTLLVWDATGPALQSFEGQYPNGVSWSPDGKQFVRIEQGGPIFISDSETGEQLLSLSSIGVPFTGASWSPDGKLIASGQDDGVLRIWDAKSGKEMNHIQASEAQIWDPAWSMDSKKISVTGYDGFVHVFDVASGKRLHELSDPGDGFKMHAVWSPDNSLIAAGNSEGPVQVWDVATGELLRTYDLEHWVMGFWWSPDGSQFLETDFLNGIAYLRDTLSGEVVTSFAGHTAPVIFPHWSPNRKRVVTAGEDAIRIWDPDTGYEYGYLDTGAWRAFWSPDGTRLLTTGTDGVVRIWRVFQDTESLTAFARECCVFRELSADERVLFGLPVIGK
jgi:WD40 repeat protein/serine/threonine protein kinase